MATKKAVKKTAKRKIEESEIKEVNVERVAQGQGRPLKTVITPSGERLRLSDEEFETYIKERTEGKA